MWFIIFGLGVLICIVDLDEMKIFFGFLLLLLFNGGCQRAVGRHAILLLIVDDVTAHLHTVLVVNAPDRVVAV